MIQQAPTDREGRVTDDFVIRLKKQLTDSPSWVSCLTKDVRDLITAYEAMKAQPIGPAGTCYAALEEENARLRINMTQGHIAAERDRARELLASCRAQSESHLRARLEAEGDARDWEQSFSEMTDNYVRRGGRFRRLAARYLTLRTHWESVRRGSYRDEFSFRARAEAAEQRIKFLETDTSMIADKWAAARKEADGLRAKLAKAAEARATAQNLARAIERLRKPEAWSLKIRDQSCEAEIREFLAAFDENT